MLFSDLLLTVPLYYIHTYKYFGDYNGLIVDFTHIQINVQTNDLLTYYVSDTWLKVKA